MSAVTSFTTEVAVRVGRVTVPVRRTQVDPEVEEWWVGDPGTRFEGRRATFDSALEYAAVLAAGMEKARMLRQIANEVEDKLWAETNQAPGA